MAWLQQQQHLILRLPEPLAKLSRKLLNSDKKKTSPMVEVKPEDATTMSNEFIFIMNGKEYPALLMNLPTIVETHKTFDNKIFLKSGDIGQVLQVFETEQERDVMRSQVCKTLHGDYMPSGITPPTADIVRRRFEPTRKNETYLPYRIRSVIEEIGHFGNGTGVLVNPATGEVVQDLQSTAAVEVMSETVVEEVVDFEEWMVDPVTQSRRTGITLTLHGSQLGTLKDLQLNDGSVTSPSAQQLMLLLQHPEILVTEEDREEDQIDALAAEQAREQKRASSAAETAMDVDAAENTAPTSSSHNTTHSSSGSGSFSSSGAPLKLSLSVRRPASGAASATHHDDEEMLQDEVNDINNADAAEETAQQDSDHESEVGDNQADAFEVDDSADEEEQPDENEQDQYQQQARYEDQDEAHEEENSDSDDDIQAFLARASAKAAPSHASGSSENPLPESSTGPEETESDEVEVEETEPQGEEEDKESVNSEDSDAWMNEALR